MIYRFCGLDLQMCGKWRRSARGGVLQRRTEREREREKGKRRTEHSAGANGCLSAPFRPRPGRKGLRSKPGRKGQLRSPVGRKRPSSASWHPKLLFSAGPPPTTCFRPNRGRKAYFGHSLAENFLFGPLLADGLLVLRFFHSTL